MDSAQQDELRNKYTLIVRGILTLRNTLDARLITKTTGEPALDENAENREKLTQVIRAASDRAIQLEIDALVSEYGPEAIHVLQ